jgi:integrase
MRLSKRTIDAAEPRAARYLVMDDEISGFGLRVEPSGAKVYFVRYRANGGGRNAPQRTMTVGKHGALTPDEARKRARVLLGGVAKGDDPGGERATKRAEMTVADLLELYDAEGCVVQRGVRQGEPMKPMTKRYTMARLRHHVLPLLGRKRVSEIGAGEIERFSADVASGKTAKVTKVEGRSRSQVIVRGGDGAARKVVRDFSAVLSFAKRRGIISANAVETAAVRKTDGKRTRFLSLAEIEALGQALDALEIEGLNPKAANITRLWALTGCRRNEIAALRWSEVDVENGLLRFDDTKTGKNIRPLGAAAIAVLAALPKVPGSPHVFPAESGDAHFQGTKRLWPRILKRAKLGPDVTPHILRHSMGSIAASSGEALLIVGALLGHANARSTSIYAHIAHDPARSAADRAAGAIAAAMGGRSKSPETTGNG